MAEKKSDIQQMIAIWLKQYHKPKNMQKAPFPRSANSELRDAGFSSFQLQNAVNDALLTKLSDLTEDQIDLVRTYNEIKLECEQALVEDTVKSTNGAIFILKSQHGYEDKSTIQVESGSLSDIIAENSQHKEQHEAS